MEQLSPIPPQSNDEGAKEQKRAILASLKWGEGWSRCSIYFVQDCSLAEVIYTSNLCGEHVTSNEINVTVCIRSRCNLSRLCGGAKSTNKSLNFSIQTGSRLRNTTWTHVPHLLPFPCTIKPQKRHKNVLIRGLDQSFCGKRKPLEITIPHESQKGKSKSGQIISTHESTGRFIGSEAPFSTG